MGKAHGLEYPYFRKHPYLCRLCSLKIDKTWICLHQTSSMPGRYLPVADTVFDKNETQRPKLSKQMVFQLYTMANNILREFVLSRYKMDYLHFMDRHLYPLISSNMFDL